MNIVNILYYSIHLRECKCHKSKVMLYHRLVLLLWYTLTYVRYLGVVLQIESRELRNFLQLIG